MVTFNLLTDTDVCDGLMLKAVLFGGILQLYLWRNWSGRYAQIIIAFVTNHPKPLEFLTTFCRSVISDFYKSLSIKSYF